MGSVAASRCGWIYLRHTDTAARSSAGLTVYEQLSTHSIDCGWMSGKKKSERNVHHPLRCLPNQVRAVAACSQAVAQARTGVARRRLSSQHLIQQGSV